MAGRAEGRDSVEATNVVGGVAHAATILPVAVQEECLGRRLPWPCPDAPTVLPVPGAELEVTQPGPEDVIAAASRAQLPWPIAADQLGVVRQRVQDLLDLDPALGQ